METAAASIAIFQLVDRIVNASKYIIDTVKDAPHDIQVIHDETVALRTILQPLKTGRSISTLSGSEGPLERCQKTLENSKSFFQLKHTSLFLERNARRKP